jgi:hypothetical protein
MQQQLVQQQQQMMHQQQLMQQQPIIIQQMTQNHASMMAQPSYPMQKQAMSMSPQNLLYAQGPPPREGSGIDLNCAAAILALYTMNKNG